MLTSHASLPPAPAELALARVPQLLDMLVAKAELKPEQKEKILTDILQHGREGFSGDMALADGFITKAQLQTALDEQASCKAEAALQDIQTISTHGPIDSPTRILPNWGNNGINSPVKDATRTHGAAAAANIAENLVLLANAHPDPQMLPVIAKGVMAAAYLTRGIEHGNSAAIPLAKLGEHWRETMNNALILAVQSTPDSPPRDAVGKPVDIYTYIAARNAEVSDAMAQALQPPPHQSPNQSR